jgi:hypothetical protein
LNVFRARRTLSWGVLSLSLGAALLLSFKLAVGAVGGAERAGQRRAEDYTNTVLYKALTPALVNKPIEGRDYGDILIQVQAGILRDDDVVRVRIWNAARQLVFSSDQRDRLGQEAGSEAVPAGVLDGDTVSSATGARVAPLPGLAGSNEQLLRSYVPLRLGDQTFASAAVEIDQRYSAILASAYVLWRPVQIAIGVALLAALAMLVSSVRGSVRGSRSGAAGDPRAAERARTLERQLRKLERRAKDADDRSREAVDRADAMSKAKSALEQQLAESERNLRDTLTARRSDEDGAAALAARVPDLERELAELRARVAAAESIVPGVSAEELATARARAEEAETERDHLAREIERLNVAMSQSGAAHARAVELETRLAETGARAAEAERRVAELERVQQERSHAVAELHLADPASGERDQEVERLRAATAEHDEQLRQLQQTILERTTELEQLRSGLDTRSGEADQLRADAAARATELEQLRAEAIAKNAELDDLRAEANARTAELELLRSAAAGGSTEAEQLRARLAVVSAELDQVRADAAAKATEREELRRTDVAEVQQAHEQLANARLELRRAHARVEELEEHARKSAAATVDASLRNGSNGSTPEAEHGLFAEPTGSGSPVFEPAEEATVGSRLSAFHKRRHSPRIEEAPPLEGQRQPATVAETHEAEPEPEPAMPEISPEGLSLRERLTRAAAARNRVSTPSDSDEH